MFCSRIRPRASLGRVRQSVKTRGLHPATGFDASQPRLLRLPLHLALLKVDNDLLLVAFPGVSLRLAAAADGDGLAAADGVNAGAALVRAAAEDLLDLVERHAF